MVYADLLLDAICVVSAEGRFVSVSAACERIFGYAPEEMVGMRMLDLVHEEDRERTRAAAERVMRGGIETHFENRYRRKDGGIAHIMWTARWSPADGVRIGVARDVTALKQAQQRQAAVYAISEAAHLSADLTDLAARIHTIISTLMPAENFAVALHDVDRDELSYLYHVDERAAPGTPPPMSADTLCGQVIRHGRELLLPARNESPAPGTASEAPDGNGAHSWLGVPLKSADRTIGALVVKSYDERQSYDEADRDLLQFVSIQVAQAIVRKRLFQRLEHMARYDGLTGLANREAFHERLRAALAPLGAPPKRLAVLYLDLDGFKHINDTYGHALGDTLLKLAGQRLRHGVRDSSLVARLGGDEFAVLLENLRAPAEAERVAAALRQTLRQPFDVSGQRLQVGVSIGVAVSQRDGTSAEELLRRADQAMYAEKRAPRTAPDTDAG
ncbi:diguanylate cyclase [Salinicola sp. JS01]|uniref:sensor domain-containing protein n=1 Tax=Salinicola sp. JS01 TaxID=3050071 RepID=UPI00255BC5E6|nr:diguanylate cyclase [Salinicola sp. JS01]WIX32366.1 diguanylate cyclase [Salinicola sp. JS01]